jgi:hypothetical protein
MNIIYTTKQMYMYVERNPVTDLVIKFTSCLPMVSGCPSSSTTKTGHHNIAEILLNVALNTINKINPNDLNHDIIISNGVILVNLIFPIVQ